MNFTEWVYQRVAPGEFKALTRNHWNRWLHGEVAIPTSEDGVVRIAALYLSMVERRAQSVERVDCMRFMVDERGFLLPAFRLEQMARASVRSIDWEPATRAPRQLIDAEANFQRAQYQWKPTADDMRGLALVVNQRVGRRVLNQA